jgi:hypothetical protein
VTDQLAPTAPADAGEPPEEAAAPAEAEPADAPDRGAKRRRRLAVAGLTALVALPLVVAAAALHAPRWYPLLDLSQTELRVRDVGTSHTPLIGLIGRIRAYNHDGSHPGPISFYALAPTYRILGSSAWSLLVGTVVLNVAALATSLWLAVRRGGPKLALGLAAVVAVLLSAYGTHVLTEPWNPYLPVLWWLVFLLAVWAIACDDLAMLPVATFAGSFCAQTHVSYLGLVGGFVAIGLVALGVRLVVRRRDRLDRRRLLGWTGLSLLIGFVLWLPTLIDQLRSEPGNAALIIHNFFLDDTANPVGYRLGGEALAVHLNLWRFLGGHQATTGSVIPGLLLVAVWLGAVVVAWRLRPGADDALRLRRATLLRLHLVVGMALVLGLVSASRILNTIWFYLMLWAWPVTALVLLAIGWTAATVLGARPGGARRAVRVAAPALAALVLVAWLAPFTDNAASAEVVKPRVSAYVGLMTDEVVPAIDDDTIAGSGGPDGRYLLTWTDGVDLGAAGWGLLDELERRGYDVGVVEHHGVGAKSHRVLFPGQQTAEIHVSVGPDIPQWEDNPDVTTLGVFDLRTPAERAEYDRLKQDLADELVATDRAELVPKIDEVLFSFYFDTRLSAETRNKVQRMVAIGLPTAVFALPKETPEQ